MLAVLLTPLFMTQADATIVNVAGPSIHAHLRASGAELELVVGGYLLAVAMLLITGARLGQLLGHRRMFLGGLAAFTLASLACGLAPTPLALVAARIAQGCGAALMVPQVLSGIQLSLEGPARVRALSLYAVALAAGAVLGQVLGGVIVSTAGWRPIFLVNVPVGLAVIAAGRRVLPADPPRDAAARLDLPGVATLSGAVALIVLPLVLGRQAHWPAWTWICLAASLPLLAAFVAVERRAAWPLVNLHVIRRPPIAWGLLPQAVAISTYYALLFTLALYLQQGLGRSALVSGLTLVAWVAAFGVPGRLLGRVPERLRPVVPVLGCAMLAAAYVGISASLFAGWHAEALLVVLLGLGGLGLGTTFSSILTHLTTAATPRYAPDISGVFTTTLQIAGAIGVATFGTVYLSLSADPTQAFATVTAAFAVAAALAGGMAWRATH